MSTYDSIYCDLLAELLQAPERSDRTGTGTRSLFGQQYRIRLDTEFPLLTTKYVHTKAVIHELLWMLRGETNIRSLVQNGVNIWNDWPLKHYNETVANNPQAKDSLGRNVTMSEFVERIRTDEQFAERYGDCGPIYGKQWRRWAGKVLDRANEPIFFDDTEAYLSTDHHANETVLVRQQSIDQIATVLQQLRTTPQSRRMIVSAWNVADIEEMSVSGLPPCHTFFQFYTREIPYTARLRYCVQYEQQYANEPAYRVVRECADERPLQATVNMNVLGVPVYYLDCQLYMRSCDAMLGLPFNAAQYALLTHLMASCVGMLPGGFVHTFGDLHLYSNHYTAAEEQINRPNEHRAATLTLNNRSYTDPAQFTYEDIVFNNYQHAGKLTTATPVAV